MMKKIIAIFLFAVTLIVTQSKAQSAYSVCHSTITGSTSTVSCISTTPNYLYTPELTQSWHTACFQATITRVSAAIGGTFKLQGSVDGTNFYNASFNLGDTVTIANSASQTLNINVHADDGLIFRYYRGMFVNASSDTATAALRVFLRQ